MDKKKASKTRFALYRRVSHSLQAERDLSLPEQAAQQREYVAREGGTIIQEFEDSAISGRSADARPAFQEMIAAAKRGEFDVILVHKSDRAFRNKDEAATYRLMTLKMGGVRWASVTEAFFGSPEPADKLLTGIMESVSEFYIDNLSAETKKGIRSAAVNKGRQNGPPPYGYRWREVGKRGEGWVRDDEDALRVLYMYEYMASHSVSIRAMCRHLNTLGWPAPGAEERGLRERGLPSWHTAPKSGWIASTVRNILTSRNYIGEIIHLGEWMPGTHEAIMSIALWETVNAMIVRRGSSRSEESEALFAGGILRCPICADKGFDSKLVVRKTRGSGPQKGELRDVSESNQKQYITYVCAKYTHQIHTQGYGLEVPYLRQQTMRKAMVSGQGTPAELNATPDYDWNCPGYRCSEPRVLKLVSAFLDAMPKTVILTNIGGVEAPSKALPSRPRISPLPVLSRLKAIPEQRMRYMHLYAQGIMKETELKGVLTDLAEQEVTLLAQIEREEARGSKEEALPTEQDLASLLSGILRSKALSLRQQRDRLRDYVRSILPAADKKSIRITFYQSPEQS